MKLRIKSKIELAAFRVLKAELGLNQLLKILPLLNKRKKKGEPFNNLPPPITEKDKESRALIGDAILLYRALGEVLSQQQAEHITRKVITESAVAQLSCLVPKLKKAELNRMSEQEKRQKFTEIIDKFPNADYVIVKAEEDLYHYNITRCRLVELIVAAGHPELSNAFCAGDGLFFERHQPDIEFNRDTMIGEGCKQCEFRFKVK